MSIQKIKGAVDALRSYGADGLADAVAELCVFDEEQERALFEVGHTPPNGVYWSAEFNKYMTSFDHLRCIEYNGMLRGWLDCAKSRASR